MVRIHEHDPEMILNHVEGNLSLANRASDKGHDHIMGMVEQELVAGAGRDLLKGDKGIGAQLWLIADPVWFCRPFGFDEEFLQANELTIIQGEHHVGLMNDGGINSAEAVVKGCGSWIIIRTDRGDQINGFTGRGT